MPPTELFKEEIYKFIRHPFPLWETGLTDKLVVAVYEGLQAVQINNRLSYNTATAFLQKESTGDKQVLFSFGQNEIYLESANSTALNGFYIEHGLVPLTKQELVKEKAATKLKAALNLLATIPECIECVVSLVNCIQVIASEGPDYDTSYSHPDIPFTIFVSVCDDDSLNPDLRVAENILHEAMHLKLTLIQEYIEFVKLNSVETFFSPWRNVQRPLMGVLHGLFVFRAIHDFFQNIREQGINNTNHNFATHRIADIATDFQALQYFSDQRDLTKDGATLSANLLPLN